MAKKNYGTNTVTISDCGERESTFFIEPWIKERFDNKIIPDIRKKDKDCVIAIDGNEGSGKSTLGLQWCRYIDSSFNLSRVVFTPEEFRDAIYKAKKGQAIMFDEAFTGFSSRAALSGVNKTLISLMMQIRQKNLFIVIVLPTIFLLDKYISIFRTRVLIHVYEVRGRRGFFKVYSSKKKKLLILHKDARAYSYGIYTRKKGRFYGVFALGDKEEDKKYEWLLNLWCPHILKRETLDIAKHRLNLHPSLVPHCRGNDNAAWAIRKELPAGVSLIEMDEDVDVGYLYAQREIKYAFPIRGKELHQILQDEVIELFRQNWPEIFREEIVAVPQAGTESLHTRKMTEKDRVRTWTERESIKDLCMWILAHDFYPNTTAEMDINGMRYKLTINIENINDK